MQNNIWFELVFIFIIAPGLTCLMEVPIVRKFKITENIKYIVLVNLLTNYILNIGGVFIDLFFGNTAYFVWCCVFEAILIPVSEAFLYKMVSERRFIHIIHISYLANAVSFGIGLLITEMLKRG